MAIFHSHCLRNPTASKNVLDSREVIYTHALRGSLHVFLSSRNIDRGLHSNICVCVCMYMYIYIYNLTNVLYLVIIMIYILYTYIYTHYFILHFHYSIIREIKFNHIFLMMAQSRNMLQKIHVK